MTNINNQYEHFVMIEYMFLSWGLLIQFKLLFTNTWKPIGNVLVPKFHGCFIFHIFQVDQFKCVFTIFLKHMFIYFLLNNWHIVEPTMFWSKSKIRMHVESILSNSSEVSFYSTFYRGKKEKKNCSWKYIIFGWCNTFYHFYEETLALRLNSFVMTHLPVSANKTSIHLLP